MLLNDKDTTELEYDKVKNMLDQMVELRKENLHLKMELAHFKSQVVSMTKLAELDSNRYNILRRVLKGVKR